MSFKLQSNFYFKNLKSVIYFACYNIKYFQKLSSKTISEVRLHLMNIVQLNYGKSLFRELLCYF